MTKSSVLFLAIALVLSSIILAFGLTRMHTQTNYVTVKGLSEREVIADRAWWSINSQINANNTEQLTARLQNLEGTIRSFLSKQGFSEDEIGNPNVNVYQNTYEGKTTLNGDFRLSVTTKNIEKVKKASKSSGNLLNQGIFLQSDQWSAGPKYYFTEFKRLKKEMLAEATKEAKAAAQEFANNSGSQVGEIRRANQGVFQIQPGNRTQENEVFFPDKIVRVVSTVDYYLD